MLVVQRPGTVLILSELWRDGHCTLGWGGVVIGCTCGVLRTETPGHLGPSPISVSSQGWGPVDRA